MWGRNDPAHAQRLEDQGLAFGPPPEWTIERAIPAPEGESDGAVRLLLSDTQIDITGERTWSNRLIQHALNADGVARVASFAFSFDPSCERAMVHRVRLHRAGEIIDLAAPDAFQLLRRESNLERRMYDGALTADMQLPDIRPGDVVETWFTTYGANPVVRNAFDGYFTFGWAEPVEETWVRLRAPSNRTFTVRAQPSDWAGPDYAELPAPDGVTDRQWVTRGLPVFRYDDGAPASWVGHARLRVADDLDWAAIADLYRPGYAPTPDLPPTLETEIARIAEKFVTPAARTVEALRFVQREVRYLAVSIGDGGFVPRPLSEVWSRRFGDCKDVSRLLSAMLTRLGVDAVPALVHAHAGDRLDEAVPGAYSFNHCIVRVRLAGKTWWLDPAGMEQGGDLEHVYQPRYGFALALEPHAMLEDMGRASEPVLIQDSSERFVFGPKVDSPAELHIRTTYRSWKADEIRGNIRREGLARIQQHWEAWYSRNYGGATTLKPAEITDDQANNTLTVAEAYQITRPWSMDEQVARFSSIDDVFRSDLVVTPYPGRTQPLALGSPRRMTRTSVFETPKPWSVQPWIDEIEAPGFKGRSSLQTNGRSTLTLEIDYAITAPEVAPADLEDFAAAIDKLRSGTSVVLSSMTKKDEFLQGSNLSAAPESGSPFRWALYFIAGLVAIRIVASVMGWD